MASAVLPSIPAEGFIPVVVELEDTAEITVLSAQAEEGAETSSERPLGLAPHLRGIGKRKTKEAPMYGPCYA